MLVYGAPFLSGKAHKWNFLCKLKVCSHGGRNKSLCYLTIILPSFILVSLVDPATIAICVAPNRISQN